MPTRQAWQYIQSNGLLTYLNPSSRHNSPPLRTSSQGQRYASSNNSYFSRPSFASWFWDSGMPGSTPAPYRLANSNGYDQNRYYSQVPPSSDRVPPRSKSSRSSPRPEASETPSVRIPVDEPASAPAIVKNEPPKINLDTTSPKINDAPAAKPVADLPYGSAIPGRANMVNSPYAGKTQLVDVSGMSTGQTVKCPYSGKLFKVPPTQQAATKTESKLEPKIETPKVSSESKK